MPQNKRVDRTTSRWCCCGPRASKFRSQFVSLFLCTALLSGQSSQGPSTIQLSVLEGEGLVQSPGSVSYRGVSILVADSAGQPVPNARVTFRLPEADPSGVFPSGTRSEEQLTDAKGRASVWGIRWGAVPGICNLTITANVGGATAGSVVRVQIG